jgi:NADP-dependent 3-hydroxy acid dehydrogenase YdfG
LILTARRLDRLIALKETLSQDSPDIIIGQQDVRDRAAVNQWVDALEDHVKQNLSVLINNAGLAAGRSTIDQGLASDWEQMIDTNLTGLLYVSQAVIPLLKARKEGLIINITSIAGKEAYPQGNVYCATKAAVDQLTKGMRMDLLPFGIRVSSIAPGAAETEFSLVRFKGDEDQASAVYQGFTPLDAKDIADAVQFIVTRPPHVSIHDLVIMPSAQASATLFKKD